MRRPSLLPLAALAALAWPAPAAAVDLDDYLVAWELLATGAGETDAVDLAHDLAITDDRGLLVVGELDGTAAEGHDPYVLSLDTYGAEVWSEVRPSGDAAEAWYGLALEPLGAGIALCGTLAGKFHLEVADAAAAPYPPTARWRAPFAYEDGADSAAQACRDTAWNSVEVLGTGWADSGAEAGRWLTFRLDGLTGQALAPPLAFDDRAFGSAPDVAHAIGVNPIDGTFAIAGEVGVSGADGSDENDSDARIAVHQLVDQALVWSEQVPGDQLLADAFTDVVVDPSDGSVTAVGWVNVGGDNAADADLDWFVARWEADGDPLWAQTWSSAPGSSEGATAVILDDQGDLLVAGWAIDGVTGREVFRLAKHDDYDGAVLQEWIDEPRTGDARPDAVAFGQGLIALAGHADDGAGVDFAVTLLDLDDDDDGVANAADGCPSDPEKVEPLVCGCEEPDQDSDGDATPDCEDGCPADGGKIEAGQCGCGQPDSDADADGTLDCDDDCPADPDKIDPGVCGCGSADADTDGDGVLGCDDACTNTPPGEAVNEFGCPLEDGTGTEDTGATTEPTDADPKGGCGCDGSGAGGGLAAVGLAAALVRRRRR